MRPEHLVGVRVAVLRVAGRQLALVVGLAVLVGQFLEVVWSIVGIDERVAQFHQFWQQLVLDVVLRVDEGRSYLRSHAEYLVANQVDGLALVVGALGQHLHRAHRHFHLVEAAFLVFHLEGAAFIVLHNEVLALGDGTHGVGIIDDDVLVLPDEEVGLAANPLRAALGLYALRNVVVVLVVPVAAVADGHGIGENLRRGAFSQGARERAATLGGNDGSLINGGTLRLRACQLEADGTVEAYVEGRRELRTGLNIG